MKLHPCVAFAVVVALSCAPLVARAEAGVPPSPLPESGAPTSASSSGTDPITVDPGGTVPGSGQTEEAPDEGCSTSPVGVASPSALALAIAALWFVRRKKR